jgi:hypothetical protein
MSTRTIKLKLLTQQDLYPVSTSARTLGEFKQEEVVKSLEIDWSATKLIDRATKSTFDLDESILPEVDSIMFITPTKTKAGAYTYKECQAKLKAYKENGGTKVFNYTGATTEKLNQFVAEIDNECAREGASTLADEILLASTNRKQEIVESIQSLLKKVNKKVKKLSKISGTDTSSLTLELTEFKENLAEFVTKDDLTLEAEALALRY